MKKYIFVLLLLGSLTTYAQDSGMGLGIILGEPTGISGKVWTGYNSAFDFAGAWSFKDDAALHLHADLLFHNFRIIPVTDGKLPIYYGIGARVKMQDDPKVGARIPVGIAYLFEGAPLDIFLEIVPIMDIIPETDFDFNGAIGIRYFFAK